MDRRERQADTDAFEILREKIKNAFRTDREREKRKVVLYIEDKDKKTIINPRANTLSLYLNDSDIKDKRDQRGKTVESWAHPEVKKVCNFI